MFGVERSSLEGHAATSSPSGDQGHLLGESGVDDLTVHGSSRLKGFRTVCLGHESTVVLVIMRTTCSRARIGFIEINVVVV